MNLTIILIAAYLPLFPLLFLILRSRSFGKGSRRIFFKLLFLGLLAAVPAFLMAAGGLGAAAVIFRLFPENAEGKQAALFSVLLRYVLAGALIEEAWKHFILRISTWKQMTMETVGDGIAAAAVVGTAFSAVLYLAWQAAYHVLPPDLEILRSAMPDFLSAGPVAAFIHALLFIPSHFGYAGLMGVLYGFAKGSEQKKHSGRAGFMLTVSFLLAVLAHGVIESLVGYGFVTGQKLWLILGFAAEALLAFLMASALVAVRDSSLEAALGQDEPEPPVEFADSEEFADFAEAEGSSGAAVEGGSQQNLLEYADADAGPETGASDTEMETGFSDAEMETGFSDTETGAGGLVSSSEPRDRDTEAGNSSPYSPLEFGSADTEDRTDDSLQSASGPGLLDAEDLQEPDDLSKPDDLSEPVDQNPPDDLVTTDPEKTDPESVSGSETAADVPDETENAENTGLSSEYGWTADSQSASPETPDSPGDSGYDAASEPAGQEDSASGKGAYDSKESDSEISSNPDKGLFSRFRKMIDGDFS